MAISKKISRKNVTKGSSHDPKMSIDLKDVFDELPRQGLDSLRQAFAGAFLDRVRERAKDEKWVERSPGAGKYSDSYANSFDFKVFGKSKNDVNLTQSGYMLDDLDLVDGDGTRLDFEFSDGLNKKKAHGHISGNVGKKRDFLGLPESEVEALRKEFQPRVNRMIESEQGGDISGPTRRTGESVVDFLRRSISFFGGDNG